MINPSIRTQLQAKISAATSAMTLSDLMLLRVAAQGLNLDETNLDTLIGPKVNAVASGDTPVSFVEAWRALGLDGNVMYQFPFDTQPGDTVFIDAMGSPKKSLYPSNVVACPAVAANTTRTTWASARVGSVIPGLLGTFFAALTLSDGNFLILSSYQGVSNNVGLVMTVVDSAFEKIWQDTTALPTVGGDSSSAYSNFVGAFETAANVFRVYMSAPDTAGDTNSRVMGYFNLTYNTGTDQVTYSAGAAILTESDGTFGTNAVRMVQGQRYVPLRRTTGADDLYCLDMQTSTIMKYTSLTGKSGSFSPFDHGSVGNEFARFVNTTDGITQLIKAGVNTVQSLPANLTSDGCFSAANVVSLLGTGQWLCYNPTTRVMKLVAFNAAYTSCSIYTVGTLQAPAPSTILMVTKQNDVFTVYGDGMAVSFRWTGLAAPTQINLNQRFPSTASPISDPDFTVSSGTQYVAYGRGITTEDPSLQAAKCYLRFDKAEYLPTDMTAFGVVIEGAAANGFSEVALLPGTVKSPTPTASMYSASHSGLVTKLDCKQPQYAAYYEASSSGLTFGAAADRATQFAANGVATSTNGVYAVTPNVACVARVARVDGTFAGYATVITPRQVAAGSASASSATNHATVVVSGRSASAIVAAGNNTQVFKEGPRS